jgi:Helicase conserved C-terminal domain
MWSPLSRRARNTGNAPADTATAAAAGGVRIHQRRRLHIQTGALQIVFCDLGTPQARTRSTLPGTAPRWNAYHELKELLVDRGMPASQVRFMHDANNDKEKAELFAACRNGRVSVIIGSTEKMGVGTNVQHRAIALHHVECPWRPADIAQREGRLLRQGDLNPEVEVIRYVTQSSFDAYLWQTVERKARFIAQVMRGTLDVREIEDIGDSALSYAEVKALATGDPRILEKAKLDADVTRLERLERSHTRNQRALSATITAAEQQLAKLQGERDQAAEAATRAIDTSGDRFSMTVNGTRWTSRADAAIALRNALAAVGSPDRMPGTSWDKPHHVATIAGFTVDATPRRLLQPHLSLQLAGVPRSGITVVYHELRSDRSIGIITRLENRADAIDRLIVRIDTEISGLRAEADRARSQYSQPFTHRDALAVGRQRSAELTEQLARTDDDTATPAPTSTEAEAAPTPVTATSADEQTRSPAPNAAHDRVTTRPRTTPAAGRP